MPLDREKYVGQPTGKWVITLERQPVSNFARAVKDDSPVYQRADAAREAGFDDIPAPPTWGFSMGSWGAYPEDQPADAAAVKSPIMEIIGTLMSSGGLVLHGEQEFEYHRPVVVGQKLVGEGSVTDVYEKQSGERTMTFVVTENEYRDESSGELVLTTRMNLIHRGMSGRLEGKVAVITGAGQGIGKSYADRFLAEGAKVVIADISDERAKPTLDELAGRHSADAVTYVQTDISDEASTQECVRATLDAFGRVDVLLNNAALYYDIDNQDNSYEYLQRVFSVNLHGAWLMARAAAPHMVEQGGGRIINQSSAAAYMYMLPPMEQFTEVSAFTYSQTKWGVVGLTKFLAAQLGAYNITVNCIAPGVTMTEATKKIVPEEFLPMVTMMTAMKRALEPEDLTGTAVFFASDDSAFVTGQVLVVDGGGAMPG